MNLDPSGIDCLKVDVDSSHTNNPETLLTERNRQKLLLLYIISTKDRRNIEFRMISHFQWRIHHLLWFGSKHGNT